MTSRGHGLNPGYQPGNNWDTCDRCGFEFRVSKMKQEWNGLSVCKDCWDPRHPQDFLRIDPEQIVADQVGTEDTTANATYVTDTGTDALAIAGLAKAGTAVTGRSRTTVPAGTFNNEL